jgi:hypothetical protein
VSAIEHAVADRLMVESSRALHHGGISVDAELHQ